MNADDWGRDRATTDHTLECVGRGSVTAVSAMVFMDDSDRSASIAAQCGLDAGLHLNFTEALSSKSCPLKIADRQQRLGGYLRQHPLARILYHPGLASDFEYVVAAQLDEFERLYGSRPQRIDGHHHLHLCTNVLMGDLLPSGTIVRRNFSFQPNEKSWLNRRYRAVVDSRLARKHQLVDYLFPLAPVETARLQRAVTLATDHVVEVETHPINPDEYAFLMGDGMHKFNLKTVVGPFPYGLSSW